MKSSQSQAPPSTPSTPIVPWAVAAGACYGASRCLTYAGSGSDLASLGALGLGLVGVRSFFTGLAALDRWRDRRAAERAAATPSKDQGTARLAVAKDLKKAGLFSKKGIPLGYFKTRFRKRTIRYNGENSLLTLARPGAGKSTSIATPTLLTYRGSMLVIDAKGELAATTAEHRRTVLGNKVIVRNPWRRKLTAELGVDLGDTSANFLAFIKRDENARDNARMAAAAFLSGTANMSETEKFWLRGGKSVLTAFLLDEVAQFGECTPPALRRALLAPPHELRERLEEMSVSTAFDGAIAEEASKLLGALKNAPQQFEGYLGSGQAALDIYDSGSPLGRHVSRGEIDYAEFKNGDRPVTMYLVFPLDQAESLPWLAAELAIALELLARVRTNKRVVLQIDEFCNLGFIPGILRALALYRGSGLVMHLLTQNATQIERVYGREGLKEILGLVEVVQAFNTTDLETLKTLSELSGSKSVQSFSQSVTPQSSGGDFHYSYASSTQSVPLLRPEEIRAFKKDESLLLVGNTPVIKHGLQSYLKNRRLRRLAAPNPYYRKKTK